MFRIVIAEIKYNAGTLVAGVGLFALLLMAINTVPARDSYDFLTGLVFGLFQTVVVFTTSRMMQEKRRMMLARLCVKPWIIALAQIIIIACIQGFLMLIYLTLGQVLGHGFPLSDYMVLLLINMIVLCFSTLLLIFSTSTITSNPRLKPLSAFFSVPVIMLGFALFIFFEDINKAFSFSLNSWVYLLTGLWIMFSAVYVVIFTKGPEFKE